MRAVVQRVTNAKVEVEGATVGSIARGLCVLVGVGKDDAESDAESLADKVVGLRIFEDSDGKMNQSVLEVGGSVLAISQFTLYGDARKGKRPSFTDAMEPGRANQLFEHFCGHVRKSGANVETGKFRAHMLVSLANDGPVTIMLDTKKLF
jgi:D-tyrosyl-tRNA(Tyr) deacylase